MTKRDYVAIAAAIRNAHMQTQNLYPNSVSVTAAFDSVVGELAKTLANGNDRFDRNRFRDACFTV